MYIVELTVKFFAETPEEAMARAEEHYEHLTDDVFGDFGTEMVDVVWGTTREASALEIAEMEAMQ